MNKYLKIFLILIFSVVLFLYIAFLVLPYFIKLDNYKNDIQKIVKENSKLNLDYSKLKIYTTPALSMGIILEDGVLSFDDNTDLLKISELKTGIVLPSLLTLTIKTSKTDIKNPKINLEILNSKQYKIVSLVEDIINQNNKKPKKEKTKQDEYIEKILQKLTIKVPAIKISNYDICVVDLDTKHNIKLTGENLILGYNSRKNNFKIKTIAKLYSDNNQNILADIDVKSILPKFEAETEEKDPEEVIAIPFINIVKIYQTYDLKTNLYSKIRITKNKKDEIFSNGYLNIEDLTLKLSKIQLPKSYLKTKLSGKKIEYNSNIYVTNLEKISLNGFLNCGKNKHFNSKIQTDKIHFSNLLALLEGILDSLNINNDIAYINSSGYFVANSTIDTDFKKLKSNGNIDINDISIINSRDNIGIKNLNANVLLDNNKIDIKNAKANINNSLITLNGFIDSNSNADISLNLDNLSIPFIYNAFAPSKIKKAYKLNSLNLKTTVNIKGKLDALNVIMNANLSNLSLMDAKKTMFVANKNSLFVLEANKENIKANINNDNFVFNIPNSKIYTNIPKISVDIDNDKIAINPFLINYNKASVFSINGKINNYIKNPELNIFVDGKISTNDIKTTLGKEVSFYLKSKGNILAKAQITGNSKKQNVLAQIYSNSFNFITPVNIKELINAPSLVQIETQIKGDKINIKNSGLYRVVNSFGNDLIKNQESKKELIGFKSIIDKGNINLLKVSIPEELNASIAIMNKSSFKSKGKILLHGGIDNLSYLGNVKVYDINIPELNFGIKNVILDFMLNTLNIKLDRINLNGSNINSSLNIDLNSLLNITKIYDIKIKSDYIDVDKAIKVSDNLNKYMPPASQTVTNSSVQSNIALQANGKFDIKKIKSGEIILDDTKGNFYIKNNDLIIDKLKTNAFDGSIDGNIKINLLTQLLTIKVNGNNIDSNKMLTQAAAMKDMLSGKLKFNTNFSLKGATYEQQVKSLKGDINFYIENGQYGPFAKLENFFLAENIRENAVFKNTIGAILSPLVTIDSTHFEELKGKLNFKNGNVYLNPITSRGDILCILLQGNMDLLKNNLDTNVRVRLASGVSDMLGPLALANPVNLVKNTPGLNIATAKLFTFFTQVVSQNEYNKIPDFSAKHSDANATKFQILLIGDVNKPLKLVKSFKWLALQSDMDKAKEFSDKYIKEQEDIARQELLNKLQKEYEDNNKVKVAVEKVLNMDTTAPKVKEEILNEIIKTKENAIERVNQVQNENKEKLESKIEEKSQQLQNSIKENISKQIQKNTNEIKK